MSVSEADIQQLESYLDDELSMADADALRQRLAGDSELSESLRSLRDSRATRVALFHQLEPGDAHCRDYAAKVCRATRRGAFLTSLRRGLRYGVGAAACVLIGLGIGRYGTSAPSRPTDSGVKRISTIPLLKPADSVATGAEPNAEIQFPSRTNTAAFPVAIQDANGQTLTVQYFNTRDEAQQFINDVNLRSTQQQQRRNSPVVPVSDERF